MSHQAFQFFPLHRVCSQRSYISCCLKIPVQSLHASARIQVSQLLHERKSNQLITGLFAIIHFIEIIRILYTTLVFELMSNQKFKKPSNSDTPSLNRNISSVLLYLFDKVSSRFLVHCIVAYLTQLIHFILNITVSIQKKNKLFHNCNKETVSDLNMTSQQAEMCLEGIVNMF